MPAQQRTGLDDDESRFPAWQLTGDEDKECMVTPFGITFGRLASIIPGIKDSQVSTGWLALRLLLIVVIISLWTLGCKCQLFKTIIFVNGVLTSASDKSHSAGGCVVWNFLASHQDALARRTLGCDQHSDLFDLALDHRSARGRRDLACGCTLGFPVSPAC